jgi:ribonuclease-3 family protein
MQKSEEMILKDYFTLEVPDSTLKTMHVLALAHMGDAVYEILCRGWLCSQSLEKVGNLHRSTVAMVRAGAQCEAMDRLLPVLTEEELAVYKRGRNFNVHQIPKNASRREYSHATGLETLFGWLYLKGQKERINQLFALVVQESEEE